MIGAKSIGRALAWEDGGKWYFSRSTDSVPDCAIIVELLAVDGGFVLQDRDDAGELQYIHGAERDG